MKIQTLIILFFTCTCALGQGTSDLLRAHFLAKETGQSVSLSKMELSSLASDPQSVGLLEPYLNSTNEKVKKAAIKLSVKLGSSCPAPFARRTAVHQLLDAAKGAPSTTVQKLVSGLQKFKPADFDEYAIAKLTELIESSPPYLQQFIQLAGYLQMSTQLEHWAADWGKSKKWRDYFGLALVRCGHEAKKAELIRKVREMHVDDEFNLRVLPLLTYVRQKEVMDFLLDIIMDNRKNCSPLGPDTYGHIICAYRVMEAVAPYIEGFPYSVGASGDLEVDDYETALQTTRQWIEENKKDYELITDIY